MDIGPEGRHTFRAEWEVRDEKLTVAKLYDEVQGTAKRTRAGRVTAMWQRSSIMGVTPPFFGGIVREVSRLAAATEFSELVRLDIKLEIEGHTLRADTDKLTKTTRDVTLSAMWDGQEVSVRIDPADLPDPNEVTRQRQR